MNAKKGKNLILGAVKGYEFEQIKPFIINDDGSVINILHQYDRYSSEVKNKMVVYRESESPL